MAIQQRAGFAKKGEKLFAHTKMAGDTPACPTGKMPVLRALPRRIIRRLLALFRSGDYFDFDICSPGQCGNLDR